MLAAQLVQLGDAERELVAGEGGARRGAVEEGELEVLEAGGGVVELGVEEAEAQVDLVHALEVGVLVQGAQEGADGT